MLTILGGIALSHVDKSSSKYVRERERTGERSPTRLGHAVCPRNSEAARLSGAQITPRREHRSARSSGGATVQAESEKTCSSRAR